MAVLAQPDGEYPDKYWVFSTSDDIQRNLIFEDEIPTESGKYGAVDVYPGPAPRWTIQVEGFNLTWDESENYRKACLKQADTVEFEDRAGRQVSGLPSSFSRSLMAGGATLWNVRMSLIQDFPDPDTLTYV